MSALLKKILPGGDRDALAEALEPIAAVPGLNDYILLDNNGGTVARTSRFGYDEEALRRSTDALRRSGALLREYLGPEANDTEPLAWRFRHGWLLIWQFGAASLLAFAAEGLSLPTLRMQANILRSRLAQDKRLRRLLTTTPATDPGWWRTAASEQERCWIDAVCKEGAS